ncbi:hypothetical protein [Luteimonas saliphila]|uniref:hypothetical protein n=1 Tax=Luteimonas saliphila TaxID=2804919 RepID=UPI00192DA4E4|nr:hypothetical protein [Luteimonas saliphila]
MATLLVATLATVLAAAAAEAAGRGAPMEATRNELAGFAIGSGRPALALQVDVVDGKVASAVPAVDGGGNLRAVRSGTDDEPMLTVSGALPVAVKFDLYLSQDGERFTYTSSCALTPGISSFEMWRQPVREFALGNPRVVANGKVRCE